MSVFWMNVLDSFLVLAGALAAVLISSTRDVGAADSKADRAGRIDRQAER